MRFTTTCATLLLIVGPLAAQPVSFERIANTATAIPGGTGNFTFFTFPVIAGGRVAFNGRGSGGQDGIYTSAGGVLTAAYDRQTPIPGGSGNFTSFTLPALTSAAMAFIGGGTGGQQGVYTDIGGALQAVANLATPIPGGTGTFTAFGGLNGPPALDATSVTFGATGSGSQAGIYRWSSGTVSLVANTSTMQPGGSGPFQNLSTGSIDGSRVAFYGSAPASGGGFRTGLYVSDNGTLSIAVDTTMPVPGGTGNFVNFGTPSLVGQRVVFVGLDGGSGNLGIYSSTAGQISALYDSSTPVPGGVGTFTGFGTEVSVDGSHIAFFGVDSANNPGIFVSFGGPLIKVLDGNTQLDGHGIVGASLGLSLTQLSGNQIAFYAALDDGTFGVYTATVVPEPSALALLAIGALVRHVRRPLLSAP